MMSWDTPDQSWQFFMGDDPPGDLPAEWAVASQAVTRDLAVAGTAELSVCKT